MAEGGRGLAMVAACTTRWGFAEAYPGRTVWAEATWPVAVPSPDRRGRAARPERLVPPPRSAPGPLHGEAPGPLHGEAPGPLRGEAPGPLRGEAPRPLRGEGPGPLHDGPSGPAA
jgi:hypothetical protein